MTEATDFAIGVFIDWNNDGDFLDANETITEFKSVSIDVGFQDTLFPTVANVGQATIVLNNATKKYSPKYTSGPLYGSLKIGLPVKITVTYSAVTYTLFIGTIQNISATSSIYGQRETTITAVDLMAKFQDTIINIPIQPHSRSELLIKNIMQFCLNGGRAVGGWTINTNPANNDTITLTDSQTGKSYIWTYKTTLSGGANEILIGASVAFTTEYTINAINRGPNNGTYSTTTNEHNLVAASGASGNVNLTSLRSGASGNSLSTSQSSAHITALGAFTNGLDMPQAPYAPVIDNGLQYFDVASDTWQNIDPDGGNGTSALSALEDVCKAEFGLFWVTKGGIPTFKNGEFIERLMSGYAGTRTIQSAFGLDGELSRDDLHNRIIISYVPRNILASGVVARATSVIQIPINNNADRWDTTTAPYNTGTITLQITDPVTGLPVGISSLTLPLVYTTDLIMNTKSDGSGSDLEGAYSSGSIALSYALSGTSIEISIRNQTSAPIYITKLQVRGIGSARNNPVAVRVDDATSQTNYGIRVYSHNLPFPINQDYAIDLSNYFLGRDKNGNYRIHEYNAQNHAQIYNNNLFAINIGDVVDITDTQTGLSIEYYMVLGFSFQLTPKNQYSITMRLFYIGDSNLSGAYWILDDAVYSQLGNTTRLGI